MKDKTQIIANSISEILLALELDPTDANLKDTPKRVAKVFCNEIARNVVNKLTEDLFTTFPDDKHYSEIILMDNIPFTSFCSHHLLPFSGFAHFLYIPDQLLIGASKPARIIEFFSKMPQIQENFANDVVDAFESFVKPLGCMLVMRAVHSCMAIRGVKTGANAGLTTSIVRGVFKTNLDVRMEALQLIQLSK
jgi:GTP cyclohydrolase I